MATRRTWEACGITMGCLLAIGWHFAPAPLVAQTFQGRVLEDGSNQPVATALVRLVDGEGTQHAVTIADSAGMYRVDAPGPGAYRLEAARLGYENFETPLLEASTRGAYPVDLLLIPAPLGLPGLAVETQRMSNAQADREIRRIIGLSVGSLRFRPIRFNEIQRHIDAGRNLTDLMRWTNTVSLIVTETRDGPCFALRAGACLPVFLNGLRLNRDFMSGVPLEMVHSIVVITPGDASVAYPSGALLLFTEAWLQ